MHNPSTKRFKGEIPLKVTNLLRCFVSCMSQNRGILADLILPEICCGRFLLTILTVTSMSRSCTSPCCVFPRRESELEKSFRGSPGKYIKRNMLLAFVKEVSHKLLFGAADTNDSGVEEDDFMAITAIRQIDIAYRRREKGYGDDGPPYWANL